MFRIFGKYTINDFSCFQRYENYYLKESNIYRNYQSETKPVVVVFFLLCKKYFFNKIKTLENGFKPIWVIAKLVCYFVLNYSVFKNILSSISKVLFNSGLIINIAIEFSWELSESINCLQYMSGNLQLLLTFLSLQCHN